MQSLTSYKNLISWCLFILFIGCFTFIYAVFPASIDDLNYSLDIIYNGIDINGHHTLWEGIKETFKFRYSYDVSRLGNSLGILFIILPKWLSIFVIISSLTYSIILLSKLSGICFSNPAKFLLLLFLILFCVNWGEHFFTIMFAFNYIVALPFFLGAFYILFNLKSVNLLFLVLIGFVLGAWHEAYSISFITSAIVLIILKPEIRTRNNYILLISAVTGFCWLLIWPALWNRAGLHTFSLEGIKRLIYTFPWLASLLCLYICFKIKELRHLCSSYLSIATIVSGFALIPLLVFTEHIRSLTPLYFLSICTITLTLPPILNHFIKSKVLKPVLGTIAFFLVFGHLTAVCYETVILRQTVKDIMIKASIHKKNGGDFFAKTRYPWEANWATLFRPDQDVLTPGWTDFSSYKRLFDDYSYSFIIPSELKFYTKDKGSQLDGISDYRLYKGYIVSSNPADTVDRRMVIGYPWFPEINNTIHIPFKGADGNIYIYVCAMRSKKSLFLGNPVSIHEIN